MSMNLRRVGAAISMMLAGALLFGCENGSPVGSSGSSAASGTTSGTDGGTSATSGTATVSWTAPAANINGMTNVAGYRIYYGDDPSSLTHVIEVDDPETMNYTVSDLAPGVWYFAVADYDVGKVQSVLSGVVEVTI